MCEHQSRWSLPWLSVNPLDLDYALWPKGLLAGEHADQLAARPFSPYPTRDLGRGRSHEGISVWRRRQMHWPAEASTKEPRNTHVLDQAQTGDLFSRLFFYMRFGVEGRLFEQEAKVGQIMIESVFRHDVAQNLSSSSRFRISSCSRCRCMSPGHFCSSKCFC